MLSAANTRPPHQSSPPSGPRQETSKVYLFNFKIRLLYLIFIKLQGTHYAVFVFISYRKRINFCIQRSELSGRIYSGCWCIFTFGLSVRIFQNLLFHFFPLQNPLDSYRFNSNPRGVCLIIDCVGHDKGETLWGTNILTFYRSKDNDTFLPCSDLLENTFRALHFQVFVHQWLSRDEIFTALKDTLKKRESMEGDAFICCIISRGTSNHLLGTDSHTEGLHVDNIRRLFTARECPMLVGKPKLLFIQRYHVEEVRPHGRRDHRDEDLETDGVCNLVPEDADIFWSHCWTDAQQLEQQGHRSAYLKAVTDALLKGQRRYPHQHI